MNEATFSARDDAAHNHRVPGASHPAGDRARRQRIRSIESEWNTSRPHRLWPRMLVLVLIAAGLVITVEFVQGLSQIIAPVFLGLNFVVVVYPVQAWLTRRGLHPVFGATVSVLLVAAVFCAFVGLLFWSILELVDALPQYTGEVQALVVDVSDQLIAWGLSPEAVQQQVNGIDWKDVSGAAVSTLTAIATNTWAVFGLLLTVVMSMFFLAMDSMGVERRVHLLNTARDELGDALIAFAQGVRRYWLVTTVFGLIVAILDVVALVIIGVPLALVWGVFSFLTNYIPNIGFVIGLIPPALLGLVEGGWPAFFAVVISYSVLNFVLQSIIQPKVAGDAVGVIPTVSFISLLFWAWVLGPLGAILALPATLLVKAILIDADPHARWLNVFIAADLKGMERFHLPKLLQRRQKEQKAKDKAVAEAAEKERVAATDGAEGQAHPEKERVAAQAEEHRVDAQKDWMAAEQEAVASSPDTPVQPVAEGVAPAETDAATHADLRRGTELEDHVIRDVDDDPGARKG
ncbi:AI-2E family transporter [Micrococcus sp. HMSC067E09]|uniref:AI-2E family transporter n=1 Tax=Micrococcus sp. HMSC067E09 TaxID=1739367 RepID=UPI000A4086DA|nr:AI-2E family transporter [Micrococcus sp. HMSC067E09]